MRRGVERRYRFGKGVLTTRPLTVARNEIKYVADVETEFADLPPVTCQIGSINQAFLNLLVNAAHASDSEENAKREIGIIKVGENNFRKVIEGFYGKA